MTKDEALVRLVNGLKTRDYRFTTVTPSTHAQILARPNPDRPTLRDIFGWNRPFEKAALDPQLLDWLKTSQCVEDVSGHLRSLIRVSSLGDDLFLHSSYPTDDLNAVFFGPDTYRFAVFIQSQIPKLGPKSWIVDLGAGSGAGGIVVSKLLPDARLTLLDINPLAARLSELNCKASGVTAEIAVSPTLPKGCDLIIANPPYMIDSAHRTYRDGGKIYGGEIACKWALGALQALAPGGSMLLYTGAAIIGGGSPLLDRIRAISSEVGAELEVHEIDPDVFGEELTKPEYQEVERIAALGIRMNKP